MHSIPSTLPKFLWHFAKKYKLYLFGFIMVSVFWATNLSLSPYAMKLIIDRVSEWDGTGSLFSTVMFPAALYLGLGIFMGLLFRFNDWLMIRIFPQMKLKIMEDMFDYVEKHSYSYFQNNFSGTVANKINDMACSATTVLNNLIEHFFARTLGLVVGTVTVFLVHPYFAGVLLFWSLIFMCSSIILSKKAQHYSAVTSDARSTIVGKIVDSMGNILNIKLFAREKYEKLYLRHYLEDGAAKERRGMWYLLKIKAFYAVSVTCLTTAIMALLIYERSHNNITVGDFALILTLNMFLIEEVFFIANQLVPFSEEVGNCKQALSIISPKHDLVDMPGAKELHVSQGKIVFENVHFQYKKGQSVFSDKSITIHPGERVGLVGFSGSGKSTFAHLILRFFDVDSGRILIDGQDIKTVTQESLRNQVTMIPQSPMLFHRSVYENIAYGNLDAQEEDVIDAAKKAHCDEFIDKLPGGYQFSVGGGGVKLSGGQRQRIIIARAILKNAPILILDEATSCLDSTTENYIQESLALLMEKKTTLVIAHRLSTLFHMDRILVFDKGRVVEDGTHAELIQLNGRYAKLWSMQAGGFIQ